MGTGILRSVGLSGGGVSSDFESGVCEGMAINIIAITRPSIANNSSFLVYFAM